MPCMWFGRKRQRPRPSVDPFDGIYARLITTPTPIIFDVGAHRGESIRRFATLFPDATIHAFEPDHGNYEALRQQFGSDARIVLNQQGVGPGTKRLLYHAYQKTNVGSFKEIDLSNKWTQLRSRQYDTSPDRFKTAAYEVDVVSIDDYLSAHALPAIHVLKVDTQGFEVEVLRGADTALRAQRLDFLEVEVIVRGPYRDPIGFRDIEECLTPLGYAFFGIKSGSTLLESPILQFDVLFAREALIATLAY